MTENPFGIVFAFYKQKSYNYYKKRKGDKLYEFK
jgi:hypothetical protein